MMARVDSSFLNGQGVVGSSRGSEKSTLRLPLHRRPIPQRVRNSKTPTVADNRNTYVIARLLIFITLLVRLGLGLIRLALFGAERLPSLTEDLADLACIAGAG